MSLVVPAHKVKEEIRVRQAFPDQSAQLDQKAIWDYVATPAPRALRARKARLARQDRVGFPARKARPEKKGLKAL